jgi:hypothetical protein
VISELHQPRLVADEAARDGEHPAAGEAGPLVEQAVEPDGVDGEQHGVLEGYTVVGRGQPEEDADVADDIAGAEDLHDDAPAVERSRELDRPLPDHSDPGRSVADAEHDRAGGKTLLVEERGQFRDVVGAERGQFLAAQVLGDPLSLSLHHPLATPAPPWRKFRAAAGMSFAITRRRRTTVFAPVRPAR